MGNIFVLLLVKWQGTQATYCWYRSPAGGGEKIYPTLAWLFVHLDSCFYFKPYQLSIIVRKSFTFYSLYYLQVGKLLLNALLYPGIKTNLQKNSVVAIFHSLVNS
jgi:hypothetical protein